MINNHFLTKGYLIALMVAGSFSLYGQTSWIKKISRASYDTPNGLIYGDSLIFYITHRNEEGNGTPVVQHLTKFSTNGEEIWNIKFENAPFNVYAGKSSILSGKDLIVSFLYEDSIGLEYKIFKITPEGVVKWSISLPRIVELEIDYAFEIYKIIQYSENDIRVYFRMNYYWEFDPPSAKNGFISLDTLGNENYREYFDTDGEYHRAYNMVQSEDTQFLKVYRPTLGALELILRYELLDKDYNKIWSYEIGPQDDGSGGPACIDTSGNVYFTWKHDTTGNGSAFNQLPTIISLDPNGQLRWMKHFGEDRAIPLFFDIISTKDGRIIACGQEGNSDLSGGKYRTGWIVCVDTDGNKLWERRYVIQETSDSGNNFYYLSEANDGGLILYGILYQEGSSDVYILKTNYSGCLDESCELYNFISFITDTKDVDEGGNLFYHYLNNSILNIVSKEASLSNDIKYKIVNLSGNVIASGNINEGNTEVDVSKLIPGIYFIQMYSESSGNISVITFFRP